jgi:hypothetical protein
VEVYAKADQAESMAAKVKATVHDKARRPVRRLAGELAFPVSYGIPVSR